MAGNEFGQQSVIAMIICPDWLLISADRVERSTAIRIHDGQVHSIGIAADLITEYPDDEVVDAAGCAVLPGFVNSHVHLYGTLAHGIVIEKPPTGFASFLDDYWWPQVEDRLDRQMISAASAWV